MAFLLARTIAMRMRVQQPHTPHLEPLVSAAVVFRGHTDTSDDVVGLVSSFLDGATPERWAIEQACERGLGLRMLKRLAAHEVIDEASDSISPLPTDPFYRAYLASKALVAAIRCADDVDVVRWVCCEYCPSVVPVKAMAEAAKYGRLQVLQWLFQRYPSIRLNSYIVDEVVEGGHLEMLKWILPRLVNPRVEGGSHLLRIASKRGDLESVMLLYEHQRDLYGAQFSSIHDPLVLGNAVENGHFDVAKYLVDRGYKLEEWHDWQMRLSVRSGKLEMVEWLHAQNFARDPGEWFEDAAAAGHLHIVEWLREHNPNENGYERAMVSAAENGHLDVMKWLHAHGERSGHLHWIMDSAAKNDHLEVLKWLQATRVGGCSSDAMDFAAKNGHLEVVKWLSENRSEGCSPNAMNWAAESGHLEIVKWLHEYRSEGCTSDAMDGAARFGHLEIVKWLHENRAEGCTPSAMDDAAADGHLDSVQWLHENRPEGCTTWAMDRAAINGHLGIVKWLHVSRTEGCTDAAVDWTGDAKVIEWLLENRAERCTSIGSEMAVRYGQFEKLIFLKRSNLFVCTEAMPASAILKDHFEIFQWLRANFRWCFNKRALEAMEKSKSWLLFVQFEFGQSMESEQVAAACE